MAIDLLESPIQFNQMKRNRLEESSFFLEYLKLVQFNYLQAKYHYKRASNLVPYEWVKHDDSQACPSLFVVFVVVVFVVVWHKPAMMKNEPDKWYEAR